MMIASDDQPGPAPGREESLFQAAAALAGPARAGFLEAACGGDVALRRRLDALLAAHEQPETLLATQADAALPGHWIWFAADEAVGQTLGHYKLLERVGKGGCGVVYVAEQTEPVRRCVALKVIKLGMNTKQVVARFEAERQALALLDQPNLAKVLDAGMVGEDAPRSADLPAGAPRNADFPVGKSVAKGEPPRAGWKTGVTGRPCFVMELVRAFVSPTAATRRNSGPRNGWSCSSRSATPAGTRTGKGSSIATSNRRTSSSRCRTACRCPR